MNVDAYDLYLRGLRSLTELMKTDRKAVEFFNQAINLDPNDARIYAGIGRAYGPLGYRGYVPPAESDGKMVWAATKALELDENLAEAHTTLDSQDRCMSGIGRLVSGSSDGPSILTLDTPQLIPSMRKF